MNRYKIVMRHVQEIEYEIDAWTMDEALEKPQNWAEQWRRDTEEGALLKCELIFENKQV